jgi:hypothetical protein
MTEALIPVSGFPLSHELFRVAGEGWTFGGFDFSSGDCYVTSLAFPCRVAAFSVSLCC